MIFSHHFPHIYLTNCWLWYYWIWMIFQIGDIVTVYVVHPNVTYLDTMSVLVRLQRDYYQLRRIADIIWDITASFELRESEGLFIGSFSSRILSDLFMLSQADFILSDNSAQLWIIIFSAMFMVEKRTFRVCFWHSFFILFFW